ncbi:hypothetical protein [Reyranella sp.]|uniref:hypothetical protein n=1 Tax=Reyranella sp. TaxID=1929291 RepID=UPI003C79C469
MRVTGIIAAALMAATVAGCASESYYGPSSSYPYRSQAYAPAYTTTYYSSPGYYAAPPAYRTTTYQYNYAQPAYPQRGGYDGYWDYQRNYRGIHPAPEL